MVEAMKALIWKEFRELLPAFVVLLASAIILGIVDAAYNWNEQRFVGISLGFCWVMSLTAALLGGANTFARESGANLSFLSSWPVSRTRVWAVKVGVTVITLVVLITLSFAICMGLISRAGYDPVEALESCVPTPIIISVALAVGLFAFTLMVSTVTRSAMAAVALGTGAAGVCALGYYYAVSGYLVQRWGPWLGYYWPDLQFSTHIKAACV